MTCLTPARLTPRSTKKVASVTMKLGSPVFITSRPLMKPMARATTSEVSTATHTLMCQWDIMMPVIRPVVPVIAPADRSNSPPIISSATTTAMIANDEDSKIHVLAPAGQRERRGGEREVAEDEDRGDERADLGAAQDRAEPGVLAHAFVSVGRRLALDRWRCCCGGAHRPSSGLVVVRDGGGGPARSGPHRLVQRVPPWANFSTSSALSFVMMAGPE